ncbi:hypothetical protein [Rhodanobacter sp. DHB23]|uniref:hypothetical protein n=1 Tax=Rhodanobacter sp. DHB23 TaxID=2775923 RepID=UPI001784E70F|nr:hypothetical protein [Rhodanobacter sp. DHB23]MBD8873849.1 hypothetical protein [Rhodanobacter sp. DHB23]
MIDHTITGEAHEQASNLLDQAVAILRCVRELPNPNDTHAVSNAIWAADDMIERAHDLIGHI